MRKALLKYSTLLALLPMVFSGLQLMPQASAKHVNFGSRYKATRRQPRQWHARKLVIYNANFRRNHLVYTRSHNLPVPQVRRYEANYARRSLNHLIRYRRRTHRIHLKPRIHIIKHHTRQRRNRKTYTRSVMRPVKPYIRPVRRHTIKRHRIHKVHRVHYAYNSTGNTLTHHQLTKLFNLANSQLGKPYSWGGTGPYAYDCSGFTQYLYRNALHKSIPRNAQVQYDESVHVAQNQRKPGDLVFFGSGPNGISHVGLYRGKDNQNNDYMYDAQLNGVKDEKIYEPWWNYLVGYGVPYSVSQNRSVNPNV